MGVPVLVRPFLRTGFHPAFTGGHRLAAGGSQSPEGDGGTEAKIS